MKKKDVMILSELRNNSRISLTNLSKRTLIPISTIFDKLRSYEDNFISKHTTLLNFTKMGYSARASIMISIDSHQKEEAKDFLRICPNINSVYKVTNGYDFMVEGIFIDIREMEEFFEKLESRFSIKDKKVFYIIDDIKRESFMTDPDMTFV